MITQDRRFNRAVTQRVGALDDEFLARDHPLGQAHWFEKALGQNPPAR